MKALFALIAFSVGLATAFAETTAKNFNEALALDLFPSSGTIWEEDAGIVAQRLGLPLESRTSADASYRRYADENFRVLGRRPYAISLSAQDGKPAGLSIIFANKGDSVGDLNRGMPGQRRPTSTQVLRDYRKAISEDEKALDELLGKLAGDPVREKIGQTSKLQEKAQRRDWYGHAILLVSVRDEYVALRVVSPAQLDAKKPVERVSDKDLREKLAARVDRRPNGDVVVHEIPMVDQGPKGFCVPATMERMLRYLGIPADMYLLAMAANTQPGGGTSVRDVIYAVGDTVRRHGRRIETINGRPNPSTVARWIDAGLPVFWALHTSDAVDARINEHTKQRSGVEDWKAWGESLKPARRDAQKLSRQTEGGHVCLIIGYNRATDEIALSDSWGPSYAERWITADEAEAISQSAMAAITW
jgi:hypothetical protein